MLTRTVETQASYVAVLDFLAPVLHIVGTFLFATSLYYAHFNYLYPVWGYYGFTAHDPDLVEYAFAVALLLPVSVFFPHFISRPSTIILTVLHGIVFVPAVVITLCLKVHSMEEYGGILIAFTAGFIVIIAAVRLNAPELSQKGGLLSEKATQILLIIWLILVAILFVAYGSIMRFASLDEVYDQRAQSSSLQNPFLSYSVSYLGTFFSPALLSIGLLKKKYLYVLLGFSGCFIIYLINASRTMFLFPVVIILFYIAIRKGKSLSSCTAVVPFFLATCVFLTVLNQQVTEIGGGSFAIYFLFRNLGLPGLTFSQYYDVFSTNGFTYWSHVKGISLIVPAPVAFADDRLWPGLGYIIGDRVYGESKLDANANLFSGDGAAAAGAVGVLVISTIFGLWLRLLDALSAKWHPHFALLGATPIAIQLTNGHFFTMLVSFGGLLLMAVFYFAVPVVPSNNHLYPRKYSKPLQTRHLKNLN